jgi:hypothetical protein
MATQAGSGYLPLGDRPVKGTICLFDVDGTLTPARLVRFRWTSSSSTPSPGIHRLNAVAFVASRFLRERDLLLILDVNGVAMMTEVDGVA